MTFRPDLPDVLDTWHFRITGQRLDLTGPGPWQLTGFTSGGLPIDTTHEGPIDRIAVKLVQCAYPDVKVWQARPAQVDETYRRHDLAAHRISQLLGTGYRTSAAILAIVADPAMGHRFAYGKWEVTGNDDDQTFRIRTVEAAAATITRRPGPRSGNNPVTGIAYNE